MILVRENVAVPHITPWLVERHLDAGNLTGQGHHHVAAGLFGRIGIAWFADSFEVFQPETNTFAAIVLLGRLFDQIGLEALAVDGLEMNQMNMDWVGITGGIVELPDFGIT